MFWIFLYLKIIKPGLKKRKKQQVTAATEALKTPAKQISKSMTMRRGSYPSNSLAHAAFEFSDGRRVDMEVGIEIYNTILEGEQGILTYKEKDGYYLFVGFQRTN